MSRACSKEKDDDFEGVEFPIPSYYLATMSTGTPPPSKSPAASDWDEYSKQQALHNVQQNARRQLRQATRTQDGGYSPSTLKNGGSRVEVIAKLEQRATEVTAMKKPMMTDEQHQRAVFEGQEEATALRRRKEEGSTKEGNGATDEKERKEEDTKGGGE